jgi:hypothetical protein
VTDKVTSWPHMRSMQCTPAAVTNRGTHPRTHEQPTLHTVAEQHSKHTLLKCTLPFSSQNGSEDGWCTTWRWLVGRKGMWCTHPMGPGCTSAPSSYTPHTRPAGLYRLGATLIETPSAPQQPAIACQLGVTPR